MRRRTRSRLSSAGFGLICSRIFRQLAPDLVELGRNEKRAHHADAGDEGEKENLSWSKRSTPTRIIEMITEPFFRAGCAPLRLRSNRTDEIYSN